MINSTAFCWIDDQNEFDRPAPQGRLFIDGAPERHEAKVHALEFARAQRHIATICVQRRNPPGLVEPDRQAAFGEGGYCVGEYARGVEGLEPDPSKGDTLCLKTGNSAFECAAELAYADYLEPYPDLIPQDFANVLQERSIGKVVLAGTQFKRCVLGTAIDLRQRGYEVIVLQDAVARQAVDDHKQLADDPVLAATFEMQGWDCKPDMPINDAVTAALQSIGCKFQSVAEWRASERAEARSSSISDKGTGVIR